VTDERRDPASANLTLSTTAPSAVVAGTGTDLSPDATQLALSTTAPTLLIDVRFDPASASLVLSTFAPTVAVSDHISISPAVANLVLSGSAPTVVVSENVSISPAVGQLSLSTVAPSVERTDHVSVSPLVGQLLLSSVAPTVAQTAHVEISPAAGNLLLSSVAPSVQVHQYMRPDADVSDGSWTDQDDGFDLYAALDEDPRNSADYIKSSSNPVNDICRIGLSDPAGLPAQPFDVEYGYLKSGTAQIDLSVRLFQGVTEIAEWVHTDIADGELVATQTLTGGQFAAITDFNALEIEFEANAP
jgi:hypothetical protein